MRPGYMEETVVRSAPTGCCRIGIVSRIDPTASFRVLVAEGAGIVELNDAIAAALGRRSSGGRAIREVAKRCRATDASSLASFLWDDIGLRGDTDSYDALANSFVGEALERQKGIPITIAAVALGIAAERGIDLVGIGMPGHFLLSERGGAGPFFDLFHGPEPLDAQACQRLCGAVTGSRRWSVDFLAAVDADAMALRMLTNLKSVYRRSGDERSLRTVMLLRETFLGGSEREEFARLMRATN